MAKCTDGNYEFFNRSKRSKPFKMSNAHFHNKHELYYLIKGNTKYFIGNEIFLLNPGDMIFVPKGIFHKTNSEENSDMERIVLVFDDEFAGEELADCIKELTENKHIRFCSEHLYKIEDIMHKIEIENDKREKNCLYMQKLYLRQLLIYISRYKDTHSTVEFNETYSLIQDIAKYISANYNSDLSLNALSKKYSISPNHLSKQFKKVTGVGLSDYINISRITASEKLLTNTDMSVTQVAAECGFNDSNYFAAVFKKIKKITPKKYSMLNKK